MGTTTRGLGFGPYRGRRLRGRDLSPYSRINKRTASRETPNWSAISCIDILMYSRSSSERVGRFVQGIAAILAEPETPCQWPRSRRPQPGSQPGCEDGCPNSKHDPGSRGRSPDTKAESHTGPCPGWRTQICLPPESTG